jgi:hypothetical protein
MPVADRRLEWSDNKHSCQMKRNYSGGKESLNQNINGYPMGLTGTFWQAHTASIHGELDS